MSSPISSLKETKFFPGVAMLYLSYSSWELDQLIEQLIKKFGSDVRHAKIDALIIELMEMAQQEPLFESGKDKLNFVTTAFTGVIANCTNNSDLSTAMLSSLESVVSITKALYKNRHNFSTTIKLPKIGANETVSSFIDKQARFLYIRLTREWVAKHDLAPLVYSIYHFISTKTEWSRQEINSFQKQLAYRVLEHIFPNYISNSKENAVFLACYSLIPSIYDLFDRAGKQSFNLNNHQKHSRRECIIL
jgi:hypothetical protein